MAKKKKAKSMAKLIEELAKKATSKAYRKALNSRGSVLTASNGKLVRIFKDGRRIVEGNL